MFTGIVQARGRVVALQSQPSGARLVIDPLGWRPQGQELALGDSVCVSGVCLTLTSKESNHLHFDVVGETLARSTLASLQTGDHVNLEPSLTPATPMGGHFVQGHIDGVGVIAAVKSDGPQWRIRVQPPAELADYFVPKGSIAIDGISLTIAQVLPGNRGDFEVALIPTTLSLTTLGKAAAGQRVNLEADILAKTVVHFLRRRGGEGEGVTLAALRQAGFVA